MTEKRVCASVARKYLLVAMNIGCSTERLVLQSGTANAVSVFFQSYQYVKGRVPVIGRRARIFHRVPDKAGSLIVLHKKCTTI